MKSLLLFLILSACISCGFLTGQTALNLQESPSSSGLRSAQVSDSYSGSGLGDGVRYFFNAAAQDRVTVGMQTALQVGSNPRLRLLDGDGLLIREVVGDSNGRLSLEDFLIEAPSTYVITFYSNSAPSAFR